MIAFAIGELVIVAAAFYLLPPGTLNRGIALDFGRALAGGAGTVLIMRPLMHLSPFLTVPLSAVIFTTFAFAFGLVRRSDLAALAGMVRRRTSRAAVATIPAN